MGGASQLVAAALAAGLASGGLLWRADRWPSLAWLALTPLFVVVLQLPVWCAVLSAALTGAIAVGSNAADRTQRPLLPLALSASTIAWAVAFGGVALVLPTLPEQLRGPALVLAPVLASVLQGVVGTPRWLSNPVARTQECWLPVVHIAGLGGDLAVSATLAAFSGGLALWISTPESAAHARLASVPLFLAAGCALIYGSMRLRWARRVADSAERVRMAAIVSNVPPPENGSLSGHWVVQSPFAQDVAFALSRYEPQIKRAAAGGAELVVLPECAVCVDKDSRADWLGTLACWAERERLAIVAAFFDKSVPRNELVVLDATGRLVGSYEKQHPGPGVEPSRTARMGPGPHHVTLRSRVLPLSTVICVDNDYPDLVPPVRAVGGVLCIPANDWPDIEKLHHQTAVWSAVMSGVPIVRATGHGISSICDGAGRVLSQQSSLAGPVLLMADVPLAPVRMDGGVRWQVTPQ